MSCVNRNEPIPVSTLSFHICAAQIYHPEKYVPNITKVEICNDGKPEGEGVERKMWPGAAPFPIHEIITTREEPGRKIVEFRMIEHPILGGSVLNIAEPVEGNDGQSRLTFSFRWTRRADKPAPFPDINATAKVAVMQTKTAAEAAAAGSSA